MFYRFDASGVDFMEDMTSLIKLFSIKGHESINDFL